MINWFHNAFASYEEQAKLFTTLISVILAITVLLLNQWFSKQKSRQDLLINKLEKLATALYEFQHISSELIHSFFLEQKVDIEKQTKLITLANEIEMISKLYFKQFKFDIDLASTIISCGYEHLSEPKLSPGESIPSDHPYIEFSEYMNELNIQVERTLETMAKKYIK